MNRFRWILLSLSALVVVVLTLVSNVSSPETQSFASLTPPGRTVLASFPQSVALRGENLEKEPTSTSSPPPSAPVPVTTTKKTGSAATASAPATPSAATSRPASTTTAATCSGSFTAQFICLLNQYRASKGLGKVSSSSILASVALKHSQWMNNAGIFSHEESDGSHLLDRCQAVGTVCRAENLAKGVHSAQELLNMWIASPGHNKNLLGPYSTAGLGISASYITLLLN